MTFQNYHKHTSYTNPRIADSVVSYEDYAKRAVELGHGILSSCEHGFQGRYIEAYNLAKQYDLKFLFAVEAYWVWDRHEPDGTNCHMWIGAKNENGREWINEALSQANETGFYRQARLDPELIDLLPAGDVWITTACVAGWKYRTDADGNVDDEKLREFYRSLYEKHRENFFFEVQYHNTPSQKELNRYIKELQKEIPARLIMGCDSHYIDESGGQDRADFLASKEMHYDDEDGWYLDYPDGDEAYTRFLEQGVLSAEEAREAIENTNCFLDVEEYDCDIFDDSIKLISLHPDWTQEQKDNEYERLVWQGWENYKQEIPAEQHNMYVENIKQEVAAVKECKMADYFIDNYYIMKRGKELGGHLTSTGRGSAISFSTNKLLGFTEVDRIAAKVHMYPERFLSATRILQTKSLPDIDFNVAEQDIFAAAQSEVLGQDHAYQMIAYGTQKASASWKMYAKSQNVDFQAANEVSTQIKRFEEKLKHTSEDEKDTIDVYDFISPEYHDIYRKSEEYQGIIVSWSPAPCAFLLYQGSIRRKIGLVKIKDKICCLMDGHWAEENHFLKNDLLRVAVVDLISKGYARAGMEVPTVNELLKLCPPEDPAWDVYKRGCTVGINQVEQPGTSSRVGVYAPKNISELCAFVAAIRPGFKSMYKIFESRKPFSYNVEAFDKLLRTDEMPQSFCLYQEQQMAALHYAGFDMSECYAAIKDIAKKRAAKVLAYKDRFLAGFSKCLIEEEHTTEADAKEKSAMVWQILEDSASYSFNACVTGNTKIMRGSRGKAKFEPTVEEMFLIKNDTEYAKKTGHMALHGKYRCKGYGTGLSMAGCNRVKQNEIIDISYAGKRDILRITIEDGKVIECTDNHKFPVGNEEKMACELRNGDFLYVLGEYEKNTDKYNFSNGDYKKNTPKSGQRGFQKNPNGGSVVYSAFRKKCIDEQLSCDVCGKPYSEDSRFEVHHVDFNRCNNSDSNFKWCCAGCHKKIHYKNGRNKRYSKGIPTNLSMIVKIERAGERDVYDVEMGAPYHNFVIDNGIVTSNSHSYCVALDSLYGAWLKMHHPLAFYETYMRIMEEKGDKEKMNAAKEEAESYFRIKFPPFRFGQDNRAITANDETNEIAYSLSSIKGFGRAIGEALYDIAQSKPKYLVDVLLALAERGIKAAAESLIKIDYFADFGNDAELFRVYDWFNKLKQGTAKSIKRDIIDGTWVEEVAAPFLDGNKKDGTPAKSYKITDMVGLLHALENKIKSVGISPLAFKLKIQNQMDVLGYIDVMTGKEEDRRTIVVTELYPLKSADSHWGYCAIAKSVGSGKTERLTVRKSVYDVTPFKQNDILSAPRKGDITRNKTGYWYLNRYDIVAG